MNTAQLKSYAPVARREFIAAVTAQAARLGITAKGAAPAKVEGDVFLVGGHAYPTRLVEPHRRLVERVKKAGFATTMEAIAYTWFNRLVALRYMELHGYLDHGYHVLSHPDGNGRPEILDHAAELELPGLDREKVVELKLDGTKDEALFRIVLIAQCNALHRAMPFLFDPVGHETEMLLPAGLLQTDSLVNKLVQSVDESAWKEIEIIGWLYQFYISEKKDEVIGKVVKSEDIPAATQLFTPNWIVKYMIQNTLGAQWLATYPNSPLKDQMEFYIEPAEQTDEVKEKLAAITPSSLNPEELTLIDPACGSGHILVEAYDLFRAIYLERGYRLRDVPKLILEKNLSGLDIDERAAQLAGFALLMKARADNRRLLEREVALRVLPLRDSSTLVLQDVVDVVKPDDYNLHPNDLNRMRLLFARGTTFGSLVQIPADLKEKLPKFLEYCKADTVDLFAANAQSILRGLVLQAGLLARPYDAVVANPPYMGSKYQNDEVRRFLKEDYTGFERDLFSAFVCRNLELLKDAGRAGYMSPMVWMFLTSYERLRVKLLDQHTLESLVRLEYNASGAVRVPLCTFLVARTHCQGFVGSYVGLENFPGEHRQGPKTLEAIRDPDCGWIFRACPDGFREISGSPIAFWLSDDARKAFGRSRSIAEMAPARQGLATADNDRFLRQWHEVPFGSIVFGCSGTEDAQKTGGCWFPYNKGGKFRRWYGNQDFVVNWENDGYAIKGFTDGKGKQRSRPQNTQCYFRPSVSWSDITSGLPSFRYFPQGFIYDITGMSAQNDEHEALLRILAFTNSTVASWFVKTLNPTLHFQIGDYSALPYLDAAFESKDFGYVDSIVEISRQDWDSYERSWGFKTHPLMLLKGTPKISRAFYDWEAICRERREQLRGLEESNNAHFVKAYGLDNELSAAVPVEEVSLTANPSFRFGGKFAEDELRTRFCQDTMKELVSYAVGCMMGRYSLDDQGIVYAHSRNEGFDHSKYKRFPADDDGIVPITDTHWFDDDACHRLVEFISVAWDKSHLEENLVFLAANLSPKKNESSRNTIRRYLSDSFFVDHLQTYKKRPIYWLFSSGKQKAIQCLVYLHRYNEGTLARMRSEYVIPLQGKMAARLEQLQGDIQGATSTAHQKRLEQEQAKLKKQQVELLAFDEKLRHYADKRICLDLDDGVKVNYGKFGDLLAEVKAVHGKKPEVV